MLALLLEDQPNRPLPEFRGIRLRCTHNSILSRNGVSWNPGAVHVAINPPFDAALRSADGLAAVRIGNENTGKWGYIDKQGKMVANPQSESAEAFAEGRAAVRIGDKWGYINR